MIVKGKVHKSQDGRQKRERERKKNTIRDSVKALNHSKNKLAKRNLMIYRFCSYFHKLHNLRARVGKCNIIQIAYISLSQSHSLLLDRHSTIVSKYLGLEIKYIILC